MKFARLILNTTKWLMQAASVFTIIMFPVAQGQAAQNEARQFTRVEVQGALQKMGLNKPMTLGQFYAKNKHLYPERLQKQIEPFVKQFAKSKMPQFEVDSVQGNDGHETPTVRMSKDGELANIQIIGDPEKFVKFNNTMLSENDIVNFSDMYIRLSNGDQSLRKKDQPKAVKPNSAKSGFEGYPSVTKETWKVMTPEQRASYFINMRLLWSDAKNVLLQTQKKKGTKTSSLDKLEQFWNYFIQESVAAKGAASTSSSRPCLVAGYVTEYSGSVCDHKLIKGSYRASAVYEKAQKQCGSAKIACNPMVFGTPGGTPICISPSDTEFQVASTFEGPCEKNNHLGTKVQFLNNPIKGSGRYDTANIKLNEEAIREQIRRDQGAGVQASKDFIDGILKFNDPTLYALFKDGKMTEDLLKKIIEIRDDFGEETKQAKKACIDASNENAKQEKNFWDACDQMQRRFIFVAEALAQSKPGCIDGSTINSTSLKCSCPDGKTEVLLGENCKKTEEPPPPTTKPPIQCPVGSQPLDGVKSDGSSELAAGECVCQLKNGKDRRFEKTDGKLPAWCNDTAPGAPDKPPVKPDQTGNCPTGFKNGPVVVGEAGAGASAGAVQPTCIPNTTPEKIKEESFLSKLGKFFEKAKPWLFGGLVIWGMYKLMVPKKPPLNPAADKCPNGTTPPCGVTCAAPFALLSTGVCGCAACPPGQTISNASTCTCSSTSTGNTTTNYVCSDGVTQVTNLTDCPASLFTCWDGTKVPAAINCPERPTTIINGNGKTGK